MEIGLTIVPFRDVAAQRILDLVQDLSFLRLTIQVHRAIGLPGDAYDLRRDQYRADILLSRVMRVEGEFVLGVTDVDIYAARLNFVFGLAQSPGRAAVISLHRLHSPDEMVFRERIVKEAVHELGHTFGLPHCPNARCVMHFSNSLADTDYKRTRFCTHCRSMLPAKMQ